MKINGHPAHDMHGAAMRQAGKVRSGAGGGAGEVAAAAAAPAPTAPAAAPTTDTAAPAQSTLEMAARKAPPGLQRVAARLEAMGIDGRSGGQSNALTQITRNLQRYMDHQGLTPAPAPAPAPEPPTTEPAASTDAPASSSTAEAPASA
jgi:hypothetical protein